MAYYCETVDCCYVYKAVVAGMASMAMVVPIIRPTMYDQILGKTFRKLH